MVSFSEKCPIPNECESTCNNWFFYLVQNEFNNAINNPGKYHSLANQLNNDPTICYEIKEILFYNQLVADRL